MNGNWGGGMPAAAPTPACSPSQRKMCDEARAAAAWLWVHSEVAEAVQRFAEDLSAVHKRGLSAAAALDICHQSETGNSRGNAVTCESAAGGGARDALNSLLLLCSEAGAEAERFASALKIGVIQPVNQALEPLARAADAAGPPGFPNKHILGELARGGDVQKAARRLQLAEEELTKAEASLQELKSLFGSFVNSSLEQKATERISRASRLKVAAQEALQQSLAADAAKQPQDSASLAPHPLEQWSKAGSQKAEEHHRRVSTAVLQSMRAAGKAALTSQQRSTGFVLHYVKDLQLFAAAEVAAASAAGSFLVEAEEDVLPLGAAEDLMSWLYRQNSGALGASQKQTTNHTWSAHQGGEQGELHGRANGGDVATSTALQLSAINAGNAEGAPWGAPSDASPPAAGNSSVRRPIEMFAHADSVTPARVSTVDLLGPCHPFSLTLEEWRQCLAVGSQRKAAAARLDVLPIRNRLHAALQWLSPSPLLQRSNEDVLLQLLQLTRVSIELPSASSNTLRCLLTPVAADSGLGSGSRSTSLHPCDLRFRVCRLMEAWRVSSCPAASFARMQLRKKKQSQQQSQSRGRFRHGSAAGATTERLDTAQGARGALRWRAAAQPATVGGIDRKKSSEKASPACGKSAIWPSGSSGEAEDSSPSQPQLAGDLAPPALLLQSPTQEKRRGGKRASAAAAAAAASEEERQTQCAPVFRSFVQRQLQLLYAAALTRCERLLKFLLPSGGSSLQHATTATAENEGGLFFFASSSLQWRPVQLQRQQLWGDEEASIGLEEVSICVTDSGASAGTGEAEMPLSGDHEQVPAGEAQRLRRMQSLKPVSNLLEVPPIRSDCGGEITEESDCSVISGSEVEEGWRVGGPSVQQGGTNGQGQSAGRPLFGASVAACGSRRASGNGSHDACCLRRGGCGDGALQGDGLPLGVAAAAGVSRWKRLPRTVARGKATASAEKLLLLREAPQGSAHSSSSGRGPLPPAGASLNPLPFSLASEKEKKKQQQQQQQRELLEQLMATNFSVVPPARPELVATALEVLSDFSGFLRRPSAHADPAADHVSWLLASSASKGILEQTGEAGGRPPVPANSAALASAVHAAEGVGGAFAAPSARLGLGAASSPPSAARMPPFLATTLQGFTTQEGGGAPRGGSGAAAAFEDAAARPGTNSLMDLIKRVRGERLALCMRSSLQQIPQQQQQRLPDDEEQGTGNGSLCATESVVTFSGVLSDRLWQGADWWIVQKAAGGENASQMLGGPSCLVPPSHLLLNRAPHRQQQENTATRRQRFLSLTACSVEPASACLQDVSGVSRTPSSSASMTVSKDWKRLTVRALQQSMGFLAGVCGGEEQRLLQEGGEELLSGEAPSSDCAADGSSWVFCRMQTRVLALEGGGEQTENSAAVGEGEHLDTRATPTLHPLATGEAEEEENEVLCSVAIGIEALLGHLQSEIVLYSAVFSPLLPLKAAEHALLILAAAKAVLLSIVPLVQRCTDSAAEDVEGRGLPARGGRAVLGALAAFERFADELLLGGVLCVSPPDDMQQQQQHGLVSALAPRFFAAFSLHLSSLTDLLSQAFLRDSFSPANPPHALYSAQAIDGWCCIHGVVEASLDSLLPLKWQLQHVSFEALLEIRDRKALLSDAPLANHFLTLQRTAEERSKKQHRKAKGWRGRMSQLVAGWEEGKPPQGPLARVNSAYLSGVDDDNASGSSFDSNAETPAQTANGVSERVVADPSKHRHRSVFLRLFGPSGSRESSLARGGQGRVDAEAAGGGGVGDNMRALAGGMERLSPAVCQLLAAVDSLTEWEAAREKAALTGGQRPSSGLQRWLVRLHILGFCMQRLPGLCTKLLEETEKRIVCRSSRDVEAVQHIRRQLQGKSGRKAVPLSSAHDAMHMRQQEELRELTVAIEDAIETARQKFQEAAREVCSLAAVHLVYYELQGDIFGNMYAGEEGFSGMTLSRLLQAFPNTVESFFCAAPLELQDELASAVLRCLVEAWCLLLAEWGYGGKCFEMNEVEALEADLDSVRQYAAENEIAFADGTDIFDRVNDFLVMLDADGRCLADAARRHPDSPRYEVSTGSTEQSLKGVGGPGQPAAALLVPSVANAENAAASVRRGRHRGEGNGELGSVRRHRSKSKGWSGVGKWVWGVYGNSSTNRESSRASHGGGHDSKDHALAAARERPHRPFRLDV
ncbi:hypothetical protein cyc_05092 [Cyclospora cayetanensis]|uniref:PATROL1-like C-terminal domain-containing protein n=1 Tax=Cyclospora cayetanensis TaxID=88456 RepID=A0A1D3CQU0_9EIME|nr:hypothetical protein cyc_05092 [Cyclospora cayetanensis]